MKVFIIDDSAIIRERLYSMISEIPDVEIAGYTGKPVEAIKAINKLVPDVAIVDIRMPGGSGIDVLKYIKKDNPDLVAIMLTNYPYPQYKKKCFEKGADYFFDKSTEFEKISGVIIQMMNSRKEKTG